jgi:hypothetical protein
MHARASLQAVPALRIFLQQSGRYPITGKAAIEPDPVTPAEIAARNRDDSAQ